MESKHDEIETVTTDEVVIAVVRERAASMADVPNIVDRLTRSVHAALEPTEIETGRNVVVYRADEPAPGATTVEAGVELAGTGRAAALPEGVERVVLPSTLAARTHHRGRYEDLPATHLEVRRWCEEAGYRTTGVSWERYGEFQTEDHLRVTEVVHAVEV